MHLHIKKIQTLPTRRFISTRCINRHNNSDSLSPEKHAGKMIKSLSTYYAAVETLNFLEVTDLSGNCEYTHKHYEKLKDMCVNSSFQDGDKWIEKLLEYDGKDFDRKLALRILEQRLNFINYGFDWKKFKEDSIIDIQQANKEILMNELKNYKI